MPTPTNSTRPNWRRSPLLRARDHPRPSNGPAQRSRCTRESGRSIPRPSIIPQDWPERSPAIPHAQSGQSWSSCRSPDKGVRTTPGSYIPVIPTAGACRSRGDRVPGCVPGRTPLSTTPPRTREPREPTGSDGQRPGRNPPRCRLPRESRSVIRGGFQGQAEVSNHCRVFPIWPRFPLRSGSFRHEIHHRPFPVGTPAGHPPVSVKALAAGEFSRRDHWIVWDVLLVKHRKHRRLAPCRSRIT